MVQERASLSLNVENKINVLGTETDKAAAEVLQAALGPVAAEGGGLLGDLVGTLRDRARIFRAENRIRFLAEARRRLAARNVPLESIKVIPEREVYGLLEAVSDVDEPPLQTLWAGLLANALDPSTTSTAERSYTSVLRSMSERVPFFLSLLCW